MFYFVQDGNEMTENNQLFPVNGFSDSGLAIYFQ